MKCLTHGTDLDTENNCQTCINESYLEKNRSEYHPIIHYQDQGMGYGHNRLTIFRNGFATDESIPIDTFGDLLSIQRCVNDMVEEWGDRE